MEQLVHFREPRVILRLLAALMVTVSLFACATDKQTHRWTFADTLEVMEHIMTEQELIAEIGLPHGTGVFNPGSPDDPDPANRLLTRKSRQQMFISSSPELFNILPLGSRVISYSFTYSAALTGGGLEVYVGKDGKILGYAYTKSLVGLETKARMNKRP